MRKYIALVFCITLILLITGCGLKYQFDHNTNSEEIKEVKIIKIEEEGVQLKEETLVILESNLKQEFLDDLYKINFSRYIIGDPMSVRTGTIIKIIFNDDSFQLITHFWTDNFNSKGERSGWVGVSCSEKEFFELVNKYTSDVYS